MSVYIHTDKLIKSHFSFISCSTSFLKAKDSCVCVCARLEQVQFGLKESGHWSQFHDS